MTDEQIYANPDTERSKAVAEAEAVIKEIDEHQQQTADEEQAEAEADAEFERSIFQPSLSLLDPLFEGSLMTDEEIYEDLRERTPDEPSYWERQDPEVLSRPMKFGSETRYVRKWVTPTIPGVGD